MALKRSEVRQADAANSLAVAATEMRQQATVDTAELLQPCEAAHAVFMDAVFRYHPQHVLVVGGQLIGLLGPLYAGDDLQLP